MLDRDAALQIVRDLYDARVKGNKEAVYSYWSDSADFEFVGDRSLLEAASLHKTSTQDTIGQLIDRFHFSNLELLDAVVEGSKVAARWKVTVAVEGKAPVCTQLFDLITFDDQGKIASFVQFADTALVCQVAA